MTPEQKRIKQLEAEIVELKRRLRDAEDDALRERLRQVNKTLGFPDIPTGIP